MIRIDGWVGGILLLLSATSLAGSEATKAAMRIVRDECVRCHKPGKEKGGLLLHERAKMLAGGDSGEVVVPGNVALSLLPRLLEETGDPHMPPKRQLSRTGIDAVRQWIEEGAPWDAAVFDEPPPAREVALAPMHDGYAPVLAMALSPDGSVLAVAKGNRVLLVDLSQTDRPVKQQPVEHQEPVQSLAWTPDGKTLLAGGFQRVAVWEPGLDGPAEWIRSPLIGRVTALAVSHDGGRLFAADGEAGGAGFVQEFEMERGTHLATWKAHEDTVYAVDLSPDGKHLLTGSADGLVKLWDMESRALSGVFEGHTNHVLAVAFDPGGGRVASAGADREIKLWDFSSRKQIISLAHKTSVIPGLKWVDDGKALVAVAEGGGGAVYTEFSDHDGAQQSSGAKESALVAAGQGLACVAATRDGKTVFAGGFDGIVHEWDGKTGKIVGPLPLPMEAAAP